MGIKVAYISSEVVPFSKTGGLADVAGALPVAINALSVETVVFTPYYSTIEPSELITNTNKTLSVKIGDREIEGEIFLSTLNGLDVYLIKSDIFFNRSELYGTKSGPYFDNFVRFAFFSRAVLEALKRLELKVDIIHCNDWQTGLIPAYLLDIYKNDPFFRQTATIFTIHNLAYQGVFESASFTYSGLSRELNSISGLEFWGYINLMKSGIIFSDTITTVSKTYCKEIRTKEFGCGLEGVLNARKNSLFGVLNGVDYSIWDPSVDKLIPANYSTDNPRGKAICKRELYKYFGIKPTAGRPIVGIISRLDVQKGFDIIKEATDELMKMDLTLILLGSGGQEYEEFFSALASSYPKRVGVKIGYDNTLAHLIEAGSDIFLMPSKYEPCGLNQIYSLKYGTIPVVRATGGLNDTIQDYSKGRGNGFKFRKYNSKAMVAKLARAIELYKDKRAWVALMKRSMGLDYSWELSAKRYKKLYKQSMKKMSKF